MALALCSSIVRSYILLSGEKRTDKYLSASASLEAVLEGNKMPYEKTSSLTPFALYSSNPICQVTTMPHCA
jgi:hypothetical protein